MSKFESIEEIEVALASCRATYWRFLSDDYRAVKCVSILPLYK